jgi:hypothetical protein
MQRRIMGVSATVLLLSAAVIWWRYPGAEGTLAFCWRMGAILAAAWLAYDDVQRLPNWFVLALPVLLIVLVRWPKFLVLLIPGLVVWTVVQRLLWPGKGHDRRGE